MGDKERCMEAEQGQEGEKEMKMILHCPPIYPLPEEIKKMEHSETVCRYCGVSYLIFHEFHQLRTQLAQLEAELQDLRESTAREKAQREALELGRLEWERALHLEMEKQAAEKDERARRVLEERERDAERALREEFEQRDERTRREMKEECHKISEEKERRLRRELGDSEAEALGKQREELERAAEEREKVLSDALQKANKNLEELRKHSQQLEERLAEAASTNEETKRLLGKGKEQGEMLRGVCARQQQALRATISALRSSSSDLTDVRGFLSQLAGAWQGFTSQTLQHSTQVFSVMTEELRHSSVRLQQTGEEKERLTQQLMEQRRLREEQLHQQNEDTEKLLRLKGELEETHGRWLSCQRRCDAAQEQLSSWRRRGEQMSRKCGAAEEEVTRLREALERLQQEARELRSERELLIESHGRALTEMEEDCRQQMASELTAALEEQRTQNALHQREQMEELRREAELELTIDREKNQLLLLQYQRDGTQLQQELQEREQELRRLQDELQEERRMWTEEKNQQRQRSRQQEALQLSQAKSELQQVTERNAELQEEVTLLQETVRRECEEREELTSALAQAQEQLRRLRSPASHQGFSRSPPTSKEAQRPSGNQSLHPNGLPRVPLARSSNSPNMLKASPPPYGVEAGRTLESWNHCGGKKRREGTLPRLKVSSTASEFKHKISLEMERRL